MSVNKEEDGHFTEVTESLLDALHEYSLLMNDTLVGVSATFAAARFNLEVLVAHYSMRGINPLIRDRQENIDLLVKSFRTYLEKDYDLAVDQLKEKTVEH